MNGRAMNGTALSVLMLAAFACVGGAILLYRGGERGKALLMLVMATVLLGNVLVWTI